MKISAICGWPESPLFTTAPHEGHLGRIAERESPGHRKCCAPIGHKPPGSLLRVMTGKAQIEHMFSGLALKADISGAQRHYRLVPKADIAHPLGASKTIVVFSSTGAAG